MMQNRTRSPILACIAVLLSLAATAAFFLGMPFWVGHPEKNVNAKSPNVGILDKYDMYVTNQISDALGGVLAVEKTYWLSDDDLVAPKPNPDCYGETTDPASLTWLFEEAAELLDGQQTIFTTQTEIKFDSKVTYYLDETIFVVTWKEIVGECVYTFSEVKIAHPSQFRRFLAGGEYGSGALYTTQDMAASVNAVTASSGDYYSYRHYGVVVNNGIVYRSGDGRLDTCFIDENGDLLFVKRMELPTQEDAEAFVQAHNVRFSLAFGPAMIENGEICVPPNYITGEITDTYSRAALCQIGPLHYMVVSANKEPYYVHNPTVRNFATSLLEMGVNTAYGLDGGQTATIVTANQQINSVDYGNQREISDIIYFATAVPDGN